MWPFPNQMFQRNGGWDKGNSFYFFFWDKGNSLEKLAVHSQTTPLSLPSKLVHHLWISIPWGHLWKGFQVAEFSKLIFMWNSP